MHFISLSSQFLNSFQIYKRQFKIFSIFSVFADNPNPTLTPSVSISVIYPTFTNCHPRSCPTTAGADFDLFLVAQTIKNLPAIQETQVQSVGRDMSSIPGKGNGYPTPVFLPGELHGQGSLAGYSPWSRKELT